jgi:hypothetical protein
VIDITDPADPRLDDFRDLNSIDRRPDLPTGRGLVSSSVVMPRRNGSMPPPFCLLQRWCSSAS